MSCNGKGKQVKIIFNLPVFFHVCLGKQLIPLCSGVIAVSSIHASELQFVKESE